MGAQKRCVFVGNPPISDAKVDVICWNGTSAGWLGLDRDRILCEQITRATGIPATSAVLAIETIFRRMRVKRFGLVAPYRPDVQQRIMATFGAEGFECVAERHLNISENFAFSTVTADTLADMACATVYFKCSHPIMHRRGTTTREER